MNFFTFFSRGLQRLSWVCLWLLWFVKVGFPLWPLCCCCLHVGLLELITSLFESLLLLSCLLCWCLLCWLPSVSNIQRNVWSATAMRLLTNVSVVLRFYLSYSPTWCNLASWCCLCCSFLCCFGGCVLNLHLY
jgi:hypothetical protein